MKRFRIQLPDKERCSVLGVKFEGQVIRTQIWLMGVASGVKFMAVHKTGERVRFDVSFSTNTYFYVDCNSQILMDQVTDYLTPYGCTVEALPDRAYARSLLGI